MKKMVSTLRSSSVYPLDYTKAGISGLDYLKQCSKYGKKENEKRKKMEVKGPMNINKLLYTHIQIWYVKILGQTKLSHILCL